MFQWHRGGENDSVPGADHGCQASEGGAAAGGGKVCGEEQPAWNVSNLGEEGCGREGHRSGRDRTVHTGSGEEATNQPVWAAERRARGPHPAGPSCWRHHHLTGLQLPRLVATNTRPYLHSKNLNFFILIDRNNCDISVSSGTDSEIQLLKEVPLYNDVMLPSTSDKVALPLSPLPPTEPLHVSITTPEDAKAKCFTPASSATPASSSVVRPGLPQSLRMILYGHRLVCTEKVVNFYLFSSF